MLTSACRWKHDGLNFFLSLLKDPFWANPALEAILSWCITLLFLRATVSNAGRQASRRDRPRRGLPTRTSRSRVAASRLLQNQDDDVRKPPRTVPEGERFLEEREVPLTPSSDPPHLHCGRVSPRRPIRLLQAHHRPPLSRRQSGRPPQPPSNHENRLRLALGPPRQGRPNPEPRQHCC